MTKAPAKRGRKELLTEELARKIGKMILRFPDLQIPVTWQNVITQTKKHFGHGFNRQMLSQKAWNDRKLIAEAFDEAKELQRRMQQDKAPKYGTASRAVLQAKIADLEARLLAKDAELQEERARKIAELDTYLNSTTDLRELFEAAKGKK
jgi:hypothetical protein